MYVNDPCQGLRQSRDEQGEALLGRSLQNGESEKGYKNLFHSDYFEEWMATYHL